jgi:hypothetical protein
MSKTDKFSYALSKLVAFPFKLVGNTFIALGLTLSIGINGVLFPKDLEIADKIAAILGECKVILSDIADEAKEEIGTSKECNS